MSLFFITHLYPKHMSIYGDMGNILAIQYRLKKMGVRYVYQTVDIGEPLPEQTDFYFIGGGQDNEQYLIFRDLLTKKQKLVEDIKNNVGLLSICGGYQLLGKSFVTGDGRQIVGIGIFPVVTRSPDNAVKSRCIGNIVTECLIPELKGYRLVGFENHGGQTFFDPDIASNWSKTVDGANCIENSDDIDGSVCDHLGLSKAQPLGITLSGFGNNSTQKLEGCVVNRAVGTYLHGSCLPKNPKLADWFILPRLNLKNIKPRGFPDDTLANLVRQNLFERFL